MRDYFNGSIFLARKTIESDIFFNKPDKWFKVWIFILLMANHKDNKQFKRGECFTSYKEIAEYTKSDRVCIDHCIRWLKRATMIATRKATRGFYIIVLNYDKYQSILSKKGDTKSDIESEVKATQKRHRSDTINKNDKNDKNEKNTIKDIAIVPIAEKKENPINSLIDLFKGVNPNYIRFFSNKTQRSALERMVKNPEVGFEKLEGAIKLLPKTNKMEFAPRITSPLDLENKLGNLIVFYQQKKLKLETNKIIKL